MRKILIFLPINLNMCFGCSWGPFHLDGSFEYPHHMFWMRNKKIIFQYALLSGGLAFLIKSGVELLGGLTVFASSRHEYPLRRLY